MGGPLWLQVVPAYGRWYATAEAMRKDWDEGKDFAMILTVAEMVRGIKGTYISKRDLPARRGMEEHPLNEYTGVQLVQRKNFAPLRDGRLLRQPYLTAEVTW